MLAWHSGILLSSRAGKSTSLLGAFYVSEWAVFSKGSSGLCRIRKWVKHITNGLERGKGCCEKGNDNKEMSLLKFLWPKLRSYCWRSKLFLLHTKRQRIFALKKTTKKQKTPVIPIGPWDLLIQFMIKKKRTSILQTVRFSSYYHWSPLSLRNLLLISYSLELRKGVIIPMINLLILSIQAASNIY